MLAFLFGERGRGRTEVFMASHPVGGKGFRGDLTTATSTHRGRTSRPTDPPSVSAELVS